jgi:HEAT repeat protein
MALGKIGEPDAVDPLLNSLKDNCSTVRWRAVDALGEIADKRAVQPLIQSLRDKDFLVRWSASSALRKMGKVAVESLLLAMQDQNYETRYGTVCALDGTVCIKTIEPFIQELKDKYPEIRIRAASILGDSGDTRAVQPLINALKDNSLVFRIHAAEALGKLGDSNAVETLLDVFQNNGYAVREAVAISVTKLKDPVIGLILKKMKLMCGLIHNGRTRARERKRFSIFIEPLIKALIEGNDVCRMSSALALSVIGGKRPIEPLGQAIDNDQNEDVRLAASSPLGMR